MFSITLSGVWTRMFSCVDIWSLCASIWISFKTALLRIRINCTAIMQYIVCDLVGTVLQNVHIKCVFTTCVSYTAALVTVEKIQRVDCCGFANVTALNCWTRYVPLRKFICSMCKTHYYGLWHCLKTNRRFLCCYSQLAFVTHLFAHSILVTRLTVITHGCDSLWLLTLWLPVITHCCVHCDSRVWLTLITNGCDSFWLLMSLTRCD